MNELDFLKGIRILDCTRLLPGPFATLFLADLGAEVIKIEEPSYGDYMRTLFNTSSQTNPIFQGINRNKKSVGINLKRKEGREIFLELVKTADVVVESFRPGVMKKLGIGYEECLKMNSSIIFASLTGWGQTGPYANLAGHDINYIGISGILSLTKSSEKKPVLIGTQLADLNGAWQAVIGIIAALFRKKQTGKGTFLDISMLDGLISWESLFLLEYLAEKNKSKIEDHLLLGKFVCYNIYKTADDKFITLGCVEEKFWKSFCDAIGRKDWYEFQFEQVNSPFHNELSAIFMERTREEWSKLGEEADCCLFPLLEIDEVFENPHISSRKYFLEETIKDVHEWGIRFPIQFNKNNTNSHHYLSAPRLGEHTVELLQEIGYSKEEITDLSSQYILKID